jgi:hypothetical protein
LDDDDDDDDDDKMPSDKLSGIVTILLHFNQKLQL